MSKMMATRKGWPWQVTAALWLFLMDVPAMILAGLAASAKSVAAASAIDPPSPGGGYYAAAEFVLSAAFMGVVIIVAVVVLALIGFVWTARGWARHLMAPFSAVFLIALLGMGTLPDGCPAYAAFMGLATLTGTGLLYTEAAETWFTPQRAGSSPEAVAVAGFAGHEPVAAVVALLPRPDRPLRVSLAAIGLVGFLGLMLVDWSSDIGGFSQPEDIASNIVSALIALTLLLIPYGLWCGEPVARKVAIPFCLVSGLCLLPYIWAPNMVIRAMMACAVTCLVLLSGRDVKEWFKAG